MNSIPSQIGGSPLRLLVTGAEGFVGRHVVREVLRRYPRVAVIACDVRPGGGDSERLEHRVLDVRDASQCLQVLRAAKPTHVLHAAAMTDGSASDVMAVNAGGSVNLMKAAAECGTVQRGLLVSSSAVYGCSLTKTPCDELHPLDLSADYARSKRLAELSLLGLERATGVTLLSVRLGPCYGPDEAAGPFRPRLSLVGRLAQATREGRCLRIGGEDYTRDWTHLDQVTEALMALLLTPHLRHRLYNVSDGLAISARDLIQRFTEMGLRVQWCDPSEAEITLDARDARKPLVIERLCADTGFVPSTDWQASIASLLQTSGTAHALFNASSTPMLQITGRNRDTNGHSNRHTLRPLLHLRRDDRAVTGAGGSISNAGHDAFPGEELCRA